jgi:hypothetical protein
MTDYAQGFKDGFAAGLEEGKKLYQTKIGWPMTAPNWTLEVKENCPKCGIKIGGVMGYVCSSPNCPTFPQVMCEVGQPLTAGGAGYEYSPWETYMRR